MKLSNNVPNSSVRTRRILQASTALPLLLAAWPAAAEPIMEFSDEDIVVDEEQATGDPNAVHLYTSGGSIDVSVGEVIGTTDEGGHEYIVQLVTEVGAINGAFGSITGSSEGGLWALNANTTNGHINLIVDQVEVDGESTSGVYGYTPGGGDVIVNAGSVTLLGEGEGPVDADGFIYPDALVAISDQGPALGIGGNLVSHGDSGSGATVIAGTHATAWIDNAVVHGDNSIGVEAFGDTSAVIEAGTVTATGANSHGIRAGSANGHVTITTTGDVSAADGYGIEGMGQAVEVITGEGTTTSGRSGIFVHDVQFTSIINNGTAIGTGEKGGAIAALSEGEVHMLSDTATATNEGFRAHGIQAFAQGVVSIDSGTVSAVGDGSAGIIAIAGGDISINSGSISTSGDSLEVVIDENGVEQPGPVNVVGQARADGMFVLSNLGSVTIDTGDITTTGVSGGIFAFVGADSGGVIDIDVTGDIDAGNYGIVLQSNNEGASFVTVEEGASISADFQGIYSSIGGNKNIVNYGTIEQTEVTSDFGSAAVNLERPGGLEPTDPVPGTFAIENYGTISATNVAVNLSLGGGNLTNAAEASIIGNVGISRSYDIPDTLMVVENQGAITGTGGTAIELASTFGLIENDGRIDGDVLLGVGTIYNYGTIDGDVVFGIDEYRRGPFDDTFLMGVDGVVTGAIDAGEGIDNFGYAFDESGTATLGVLPDSFERHTVQANGEETLVNIVASDDLASDTSLLLSGNGNAFINLDLFAGSSDVAQSGALFTNDLGFVPNPAGGGRGVFGAGNGLASIINEASITGRVQVTTAEFVNDGAITTRSGDRASFITANTGDAFSFTNNGSIAMLDTGDGPAEDPENHFNLPVAAISLRSPVIPLVEGQPDVDAVYHPVSIVNGGTIDGGVLARFTASTLDFTNSGTISGFEGETRSVAGVTLLVGTDYESFGPNFTRAAESVNFTNSGEISGGVVADLEAKAATFANSGTISGGMNISASGAVAVDNVGTMTGPEAGDRYAALYVHTLGDIAITSNEAQSDADNAYGLFALSEQGDVSVNAASVVTTGNVVDPAESDNDFSAIRAISAQGSASVIVGDLSATGDNGRGVLAYGSTGADVTVNGAVETQGFGVEAYSPTASRVLVNGTITNSGEIGLGVGAGGPEVEVEIAEGASVTSTQTGVGIITYNLLEPDSTVIGSVVNHGTIVGDGTAGISGFAVPDSLGFFNILNDGTVSSASGVAILTGVSDDTVELTENSQINGVVDLGEGFDRMVLDFNEGVTEGVGQVASTVNVESLSVDTGTWRANGAQSVYGEMEVEEGAALNIAENADGFAAIVSGFTELQGQLILDLATDVDATAITSIDIEGSGSLRLVGEATVEFAEVEGFEYSGGTFVENGELLLTDEFGGDITTSGDGVFELAEGGDFSGDLVNDGTFVFSKEGDYNFLGDFSGDGLLEKYGDGVLNFAGLYDFDGTTSIFDGSVTFSGQLSEDTELDLEDGTVDLSGTEGGEATIAGLSGQGGQLQLSGTNLTLNQSGNSTFGGSIAGSGNLVKQGEGDLKLNGDGTGFTGTGQVGGGTLSVNGNFSNASFVVNEGGKLGGAGTVGNTNVNGGTAAPGNSIDTLTVNGNVSFTAASTYEVEVNAAGDSDLLQATGTATLGGASVEVLAEDGTYRPITDYTILTADGGVEGEFGSVSSNFAFLDPSLSYSDTAVTLRLVRNDIDFSAFADTPNQAAIAGLIEDLGFGNVLYDETLMLADDDVVPSFATLTGEVYSDYGSALIETAEMLRRQTASSMAGSGTGGYGWATGLYNSVDGDRTGLGGFGAAGGFGFAGNGLSAAVGLGVLGDGELEGQVSESDITFLTGQVAYGGVPDLSLSAGVQLGWFDGSADRITVLGSLTDQLSGEMEGDYLQLSGEIAYGVPTGAGLAVEPFVGLSHVSLDLDGLTETGGATALAVGAQDRDVTFGDVGVRLAADAGGVRPFASVAYRHAWGDRASPASVSFAGNTGSALISGLPIAKDAAELSAGLIANIGIADLTIGYEGTISDSFDSHGLQAGLKIRF